MDHLKGNDMSNSKECIKANPTLQRIPIIAVTSYALSGETPLPAQQAATTLWQSPTVPVTCYQDSYFFALATWHSR